MNVRRVPCAGVSIATFSEFPDLQSRACELIHAGIIRARSAVSWERDDALRAQAGEALLAIDGAGLLHCICRVTSIAVKRFRDVDPSDAWLEGIGDRSLEEWRLVRGPEFSRRAILLGREFTESTEIVLERFEVVWRVQQQTNVTNAQNQ